MSNRGRICNTCREAISTLYCHTDMAYHCICCDAEVHSATSIPARHEQVPVGPVSWFLSSGSNIEIEVDGEDEASSWLLDEPESINEVSFFEGDGYLNLPNYNPSLPLSIWRNNNTENESIVPFKLEETSEQQQQRQQQQLQNFYMAMEKSLPKDGFYHNPLSNQSAIVSFLDADSAQNSTMSTVSISNSIAPLDIYPTPTPVVGPSITPTSREARVLRYKEKKKARKFAKTIRYASRKAYAETRPRVKGRFAKKTEMEIEMNNMDRVVEYTDGIVPSL